MSTDLPVLNNGITPAGQPLPPEVTEFIPADLPVLDQQRREFPDHHMSTSAEQPWKSPVEAVAGVGGIAGVSEE